MKKSLFIVLLLTLVTALPMAAQQYKYEGGPLLGMTGYLGEANNGSLFKHPSFTVGGMFRYNHNSRWAFKANLNYANIRGDSEKDETWYPDGANYTFSSSLIDLGLTAEFNFLNFGRGPAYKKYKPISPYMVAGVGFVFAICDGSNQASFEFTMRKEFSDRIDGLSDLNGIKHSFAKNTDWYSFAMFSVTYEFGKRCIKCNYIE